MHNEPVTICSDNNLEFVAPTTQFSQLVEIRNCKVKEFNVYATYFIGGLKLTNCEFYNDIIWQSGGHNNAPIIICNCAFNGFLDVEDCYFLDYIEFSNVRFVKNTNLKGNIGTPVETTFENGCIVKNVSGNLQVNTYQPVGE